MGIFNFGNNDANDNQNDDRQIDPAHQVANDDLLGLWRSVTLDQSQENMSAFLENLVEQANLITFALSDDNVPTTADGHLNFDEPMEISFPLLTGEDEKTFHPFFTDWQAAQTLLDQWAEGGNQATVDKCHPVVINFLEMVNLISSNDDVQGAVINPFEDNITLDRDSLIDLGKQAQARHDQTDQPVHIGDGQKAPEGLLESLADKFASDDLVSKAWIKTLTIGEQQSFFLILDMQVLDDYSEYFDQLTVIANEYLADSELGMTIAPYSDEIAEAVEGSVPFFAK
ncbi:SseB family protein [Lacticaseibacillus porcinae]|uniref:SseB family protein n=1 Tax=Lacticaseibacillus porcinae TaxID=1123687 RepID=UPI000F769075|nr:SseB family protein [Lacticaseibacillus porcinae]